MRALTSGSVSLAAIPEMHKKDNVVCIWWTSADIIRYTFLERGKPSHPTFHNPTHHKCKGFRLLFSKSDRCWST